MAEPSPAPRRSRQPPTKRTVYFSRADDGEVIQSDRPPLRDSGPSHADLLADALTAYGKL